MTDPIQTHKRINRQLCGTPLNVENGTAEVEMTTLPEMAADSHDLVHGGFIFGLADYTAMIAVNHPNVVLGASEVKFLKPVKAGETVTAEARVTATAGKKQQVSVEVQKDGENVFVGEFTCFTLDKHVLG